MTYDVNKFIYKVIKSCKNLDQLYTTKIWIERLAEQKILHYRQLNVAINDINFFIATFERRKYGII